MEDLGEKNKFNKLVILAIIYFLLFLLLPINIFPQNKNIVCEPCISEKCSIEIDGIKVEVEEVCTELDTGGEIKNSWFNGYITFPQPIGKVKVKEVKLIPDKLDSPLSGGFEGIADEGTLAGLSLPKIIEKSFILFSYKEKKWDIRLSGNITLPFPGKNISISLEFKFIFENNKWKLDTTSEAGVAETVEIGDFSLYIDKVKIIAVLENNQLKIADVRISGKITSLPEIKNIGLPPLEFSYDINTLSFSIYIPTVIIDFTHTPVKFYFEKNDKSRITYVHNLKELKFENIKVKIIKIGFGEINTAEFLNKIIESVKIKLLQELKETTLVEIFFDIDTELTFKIKPEDGTSSFYYGAFSVKPHKKDKIIISLAGGIEAEFCGAEGEYKDGKWKLTNFCGGIAGIAQDIIKKIPAKIPLPDEKIAYLCVKAGCKDDGALLIDVKKVENTDNQYLISTKPDQPVPLYIPALLYIPPISIINKNNPPVINITFQLTVEIFPFFSIVSGNISTSLKDFLELPDEKIFNCKKLEGCPKSEDLPPLISAGGLFTFKIGEELILDIKEFQARFKNKDSCIYMLGSLTMLTLKTKEKPLTLDFVLTADKSGFSGNIGGIPLPEISLGVGNFEVVYTQDNPVCLKIRIKEDEKKIIISDLNGILKFKFLEEKPVEILVSGDISVDMENGKPALQLKAGTQFSQQFDLFGLTFLIKDFKITECDKCQSKEGKISCIEISGSIKNKDIDIIDNVNLKISFDGKVAGDVKFPEDKHWEIVSDSLYIDNISFEGCGKEAKMKVSGYIKLPPYNKIEFSNISVSSDGTFSGKIAYVNKEDINIIESEYLTVKIPEKSENSLQFKFNFSETPVYVEILLSTALQIILQKVFEENVEWSGELGITITTSSVDWSIDTKKFKLPTPSVNFTSIVNVPIDVSISDWGFSFKLKPFSLSILFNLKFDLSPIGLYTQFTVEGAKVKFENGSVEVDLGGITTSGFNLVLFSIVTITGKEIKIDFVKREIIFSSLSVSTSSALNATGSIKSLKICKEGILISGASLSADLGTAKLYLTLEYVREKEATYLKVGGNAKIGNIGCGVLGAIGEKKGSPYFGLFVVVHTTVPLFPGVNLEGAGGGFFYNTDTNDLDSIGEFIGIGKIGTKQNEFCTSLEKKLNRDFPCEINKTGISIFLFGELSIVENHIITGKALITITPEQLMINLDADVFKGIFKGDATFYLSFNSLFISGNCNLKYNPDSLAGVLEGSGNFSFVMTAKVFYMEAGMNINLFKLCSATANVILSNKGFFAEAKFGFDLYIVSAGFDTKIWVLWYNRWDLGIYTKAYAEINFIIFSAGAWIEGAFIANFGSGSYHGPIIYFGAGVEICFLFSCLDASVWAIVGVGYFDWGTGKCAELQNHIEKAKQTVKSIEEEMEKTKKAVEVAKELNIQQFIMTPYMQKVLGKKWIEENKYQQKRYYNLLYFGLKKGGTDILKQAKEKICKNTHIFSGCLKGNDCQDIENYYLKLEKEYTLKIESKLCNGTICALNTLKEIDVGIPKIKEELTELSSISLTQPKEIKSGCSEISSSLLDNYKPCEGLNEWKVGKLTYCTDCYPDTAVEIEIDENGFYTGDNLEDKILKISKNEDIYSLRKKTTSVITHVFALKDEKYSYYIPINKFIYEAPEKPNLETLKNSLAKKGYKFQECEDVRKQLEDMKFEDFKNSLQKISENFNKQDEQIKEMENKVKSIEKYVDNLNKLFGTISKIYLDTDYYYRYSLAREMGIKLLGNKIRKLTTSKDNWTDEEKEKIYNVIIKFYDDKNTSLQLNKLSDFEIDPGKGCKDLENSPHYNNFPTFYNVLKETGYCKGGSLKDLKMSFSIRRHLCAEKNYEEILEVYGMKPYGGKPADVTVRDILGEHKKTFSIKIGETETALLSYFSGGVKPSNHRVIVPVEIEYIQPNNKTGLSFFGVESYSCSQPLPSRWVFNTFNLISLYENITSLKNAIGNTKNEISYLGKFYDLKNKLNCAEECKKDKNCEENCKKEIKEFEKMLIKIEEGLEGKGEAVQNCKDICSIDCYNYPYINDIVKKLRCEFKFLNYYPLIGYFYHFQVPYEGWGALIDESNNKMIKILEKYLDDFERDDSVKLKVRISEIFNFVNNINYYKYSLLERIYDMYDTRVMVYQKIYNIIKKKTGTYPEQTKIKPYLDKRNEYAEKISPPPPPEIKKIEKEEGWQVQETKFEIERKENQICYVCIEKTKDTCDILPWVQVGGDKFIKVFNDFSIETYDSNNNPIDIDKTILNLAEKLSNKETYTYTIKLRTRGGGGSLSNIRIYPYNVKYKNVEDDISISSAVATVPQSQIVLKSGYDWGEPEKIGEGEVLPPSIPKIEIISEEIGLPLTPIKLTVKIGSKWKHPELGEISPSSYLVKIYYYEKGEEKHLEKDNIISIGNLTQGNVFESYIEGFLNNKGVQAIPEGKKDAGMFTISFKAKKNLKYYIEAIAVGNYKGERILSKSATEQYCYGDCSVYKVKIEDFKFEKSTREFKFLLKPALKFPKGIKKLRFRIYYSGLDITGVKVPVFVYANKIIPSDTNLIEIENSKWYEISIPENWETDKFIPVSVLFKPSQIYPGEYFIEIIPESIYYQVEGTVSEGIYILPEKLGISPFYKAWKTNIDLKYETQPEDVILKTRFSLKLDLQELFSNTESIYPILKIFNRELVQIGRNEEENLEDALTFILNSPKIGNMEKWRLFILVLSQFKQEYIKNVCEMLKNEKLIQEIRNIEIRDNVLNEIKNNKLLIPSSQEELSNWIKVIQDLFKKPDIKEYKYYIYFKKNRGVNEKIFYSINNCKKLDFEKQGSCQDFLKFLESNGKEIYHYKQEKFKNSYWFVPEKVDEMKVELTKFSPGEWLGISSEIAEKEISFSLKGNPNLKQIYYPYEGEVNVMATYLTKDNLIGEINSSGICVNCKEPAELIIKSETKDDKEIKFTVVRNKPAETQTQANYCIVKLVNLVTNYPNVPEETKLKFQEISEKYYPVFRFAKFDGKNEATIILNRIVKEENKDIDILPVGGKINIMVYPVSESGTIGKGLYHTIIEKDKTPPAVSAGNIAYPESPSFVIENLPCKYAGGNYIEKVEGGWIRKDTDGKEYIVISSNAYDKESGINIYEYALSTSSFCEIPSDWKKITPKEVEGEKKIFKIKVENIGKILDRNGKFLFNGVYVKLRITNGEGISVVSSPMIFRHQPLQKVKISGVPANWTNKDVEMKVRCVGFKEEDCLEGRFFIPLPVSNIKETVTKEVGKIQVSKIINTTTAQQISQKIEQKPCTYKCPAEDKFYTLSDMESKNKFTLKEEGIYSICAYGLDSLGYSATSSECYNIYIDKTPPEFSRVEMKVIERKNSSAKIEFSFDFSDNLSGIKEYQYKIKYSNITLVDLAKEEAKKKGIPAVGLSQFYEKEVNGSTTNKSILVEFPCPQIKSDVNISFTITAIDWAGNSTTIEKIYKENI